MATRKKSTKGKSKTKAVGLLNDKQKKIIGVFGIFVTLFLFISFVSYLFTWKLDQDKVLKLSSDFFFNAELEVSNWLGRLGAALSHVLIYWGFGLASLILIYLVGETGFRLIQQRSLKPLWKKAVRGVLIMVLLSVVLEFIFRTSSFSWGGAFGEGMCHWLTNFLGQVGLMLLLLSLSLAYFIWLFNLNLSEFSFGNLKNLKFNWRPNLGALKDKAEDVIQNLPKVDIATSENADKNPDESSKLRTLRPGEQQLLDLDVEAKVSRKNKPIEAVEEELILPKMKIPKKVPNDELEIIAQDESRKTLSVEEEDQSITEPYDPTLDLSKYKAPGLDLLYDYDDQKIEIDRLELEENKNQIIRTLLNYKIEITKIRATIGPTVTLYEIVPAPGIRISKIKNLEDDIALSLAALGIRIIAPIPGKGTIGIEVPNKKKQIVSLKEIIKSEKFQKSKMELPIALGKTIANEVFVADLAKMPHLLMAGATGQGKSVGINAAITSLLYKKHPSQLKFVLIDPKKVELFPYSHIDKHFLATLPDQEEPIITDTTKVINTLNSLCIEMDTRYDLLKKARARNIKEYNNKFVGRKLNPENGHKYLPFIVLVIDEFADLIMTAGKEIELPIGRLAQLARAVGIHLIIATQRPSVNIITGIIKANFPARIAYKVTSKVDSRTILDSGGAEQLIGRGDMLLSVGGNVIRLQCAFVDTPEVESIVDHISEQQGYPSSFMLPEYTGEEATHSATGMKLSELDEMFEDAARLVVSQQHGSTSMIQRRLKLGYNRAGRIMDQLEVFGIVGPSQGSKPREVLMFSEMELDRFLEELRSTA